MVEIETVRGNRYREVALRIPLLMSNSASVDSSFASEFRMVV